MKTALDFTGSDTEGRMI